MTRCLPVVFQAEGAVQAKAHQLETSMVKWGTAGSSDQLDCGIRDVTWQQPR